MSAAGDWHNVRYAAKRAGDETDAATQSSPWSSPESSPRSSPESRVHVLQRPAPLNPWKWPSRPWARLHLDFAGPFQGKTILVVIDAHSKWIEAICTASTSLVVVINELQTLFSKFGLPETIVTDNGTGFTSQKLKSFLKDHGVKHITSSPYHPVSNGLAVQIVKRGLKKVTVGNMSSCIAQVLFTYRITHNTTGVSLAELLLGRKLRTKLDLIRPNTAKKVEERQEAQKAKHDSKAKARAF